MPPDAPISAASRTLEATPSVWRRLWPILLLAATALAAYGLGLHRYLSLEALAAHRGALHDLVSARPVAALAAYALLYVMVVTLSLPGGAVLSLTGGFLFGPFLGSAVAVLAATLGACLIFLVARRALSASIAARGGALLAKLGEELRREGFWYLLSLRLLPVVPFWLANLAPALAGMPFRSYAVATLIGIIPGTAVYAGIGAGLGQVIDSGGEPDLAIIFSPGILLPLIGLAALSLVGAWWRRLARKSPDRA